MYDMAKKARSAMKAKAKSLSSADPHQKVDSSTWTPPEALNTEAKTGLRPISRRAFKSGGSVKGEKAKCNMGRKPRKSGGEATKYAIAKINRNVKEANEERPGIKHVGGMKKGGRTKKQGGGGIDEIAQIIEANKNMPVKTNPGPLTREQAGIKPGSWTPEQQKASREAFDREQQKHQRQMPQNRKAGGRTKKMDGGPMAGAQEMMSKAQKTGGVPATTLNFTPAESRFSKSSGLKKGGKAHADEAMDKALIKKMVKPSARKGKMEGGAMGALGGLLPALAGAGDKAGLQGLLGLAGGMKSGGKAARKGRANGGRDMIDAAMAGDRKLDSSPDDASKALYLAVNANAGDRKPRGKMANSLFREMNERKGHKLAEADQSIYRRKDGGKAKHSDEKMDIALIKKMTKPEARKGRAMGGENQLAPNAGIAKQYANYLADKGSTSAQGQYLGLGNAAKDIADAGSASAKGQYVGLGDSAEKMKKGGKAKRTARKEGGGVFSGPGYPGKIPGVTGGRIARATGGKTKGKGKGKTNINIIIAAGKPAGGAEMMGPPPGMDAGPQGLPVPVPAPQGGAPGAAPMPMPMPMPMPAAPAGGPPMPRKSGGRLTAKASSYKDMTAGSGSGEGRLQKTDIAKARMGRKAGGKAYRSYKDMDAGAGSGLGRLEKTEIQARKR